MVLHAGLILLLPLLLTFVASREISSYADAEIEPQRVIYYQIPKTDPNEKLPRITPAGEGGQPGAGELQALLARISEYETSHADELSGRTDFRTHDPRFGEHRP